MDRYAGTFSWVHESGLILRAMAARTETEDAPGNFGVVDNDEYGLSIGYYLANSTTIELGHSQGESDGSSRIEGTCQILPLLFSCIESSSFRFETEADTTSLGIKHVGSLLGQDLAVRVDYSRVDLDTTARSELVRRDQFGNVQTLGSVNSVDTTTDTASAELTWYITRRLGVGVGYARQDADDAPDANSYRLEGSWFVTENIYLGATLERTEIMLLTGEDDLSSATLKAGIRW